MSEHTEAALQEDECSARYVEEAGFRGINRGDCCRERRELVAVRDRYRNALLHIATAADTVEPMVRATSALNDDSIAVASIAENGILTDAATRLSEYGWIAPSRKPWDSTDSDIEEVAAMIGRVLRGEEEPDV